MHVMWIDKSIVDEWAEFTTAACQCKACDEAGLREAGSHPLFMKQCPARTDLLFVLEAPNADDTFDRAKQYITVDPGTDPSGTFMWNLFTEELQLDPQQHLFVTNSVLCLPCAKNGKRPVRAKQSKTCSRMLRQLIDRFQPLIVCSLGVEALRALARIDNHHMRKISEAVGNPIEWYGRVLYPLYHPSNLGKVSRSEGLQRSDWRQLRELYLQIVRNVEAQSGALSGCQ